MAAPSVGSVLAVTVPLAVPMLSTEVSVKSVVPVTPQPASGAFGHVLVSDYVHRPLPSDWMLRLPEWPPPQPPTNGAIPGTSACAGAANASAAIPSPACAIFLISMSWNDLTVLSALSNEPHLVGNVIQAHLLKDGFWEIHGVSAWRHHPRHSGRAGLLNLHGEP